MIKVKYMQYQTHMQVAMVIRNRTSAKMVVYTLVAYKNDKVQWTVYIII